MVGIRFGSMRHMWKGRKTARGWYLFFGFYWFAFGLFKRWPLETVYGYRTGFIFSYKPDPTARGGDLMWLRNKKHLRLDDLDDKEVCHPT